jgi:hypothetical protein
MELEKALAEFRLQTKRGWGGRGGGLPADDSTTSWRVRAVTARFSFFFFFSFFFCCLFETQDWIHRQLGVEMRP